MASDFTEVDDSDSQVDPENRNDTEFTWESTYDGPTDSEGNPDPEDRDDQDFSWESEPEEPTTVILQRGAHYDVLRDLNAITFVPGSACQMSQEIARIRYWSRGNTSTKTPVETEEQSTAPNDPQQELKEDVDKTSTAETTNPAPQTTQPSTRTILTVPENRATGRRQPVPTRVPVAESQPSPKSGKIVSANPSGTVNTAGVTASPPPTDAVWMFLFNPEELQLSSGPDYNRAETWGVSDPNNSGQPLSWRSNRNRKLSFGKVLLHGYTFGKRVDTLEAGLQQLFMARDEENGSDGPPVLEFVWGRRIFGPCVIQNIQVREKAWDKGILVNAEVSFELEQVPEWTINDGEVDILRPGRQPLVNDPLLPGRNQNKTPEQKTKEEKEKKNSPGGGGGGKRGELSQCNNLSSDIRFWEDFIKRVEIAKSGKRPSSYFVKGVEYSSGDFISTFSGNSIAYITQRNKAIDNSFYGANINKSLKFECKREGFDSRIKDNLLISMKETSDTAVLSKLNREGNEKIISCSQTIRSEIQKIYGNLKCKQVIEFIGPLDPTSR